MNKVIESTYGEWEVPSEFNRPVFIGDAHHDGTVIWRDSEDGAYWIAMADLRTVVKRDRVLLLEGVPATPVDPIPLYTPHGCCLDRPLGVWLVGVSEQSCNAWIKEQGMEVLWDSKEQ